MDRIYFEKQQGSFCAQHCMNNLLQSSIFTVDVLADIAHDLDRKERIALGQIASNTSCFNNDETGFFSIQVLIQGFKNLGLEVTPYLRKCLEAEEARENPTDQRAFICHYKDHWFGIRKFGTQWFDLNSLQSRPKLISNTFLSLYLKQLCSDGHTIYFVTGDFPECEADTYLMMNPVPEVYVSSGSTSRSLLTEEDEELRTALHLSRMAEDGAISHSVVEEIEQRDLEKTLELSLKDAGSLPIPTEVSTLEEDDLQAAIALSLQQGARNTRPREVDVIELRKKRSKYFRSE